MAFQSPPSDNQRFADHAQQRPYFFPHCFTLKDLTARMASNNHLAIPLSRVLTLEDWKRMTNNPDCSEEEFLRNTKPWQITPDTTRASSELPQVQYVGSEENIIAKLHEANDYEG